MKTWNWSSQSVLGRYLFIFRENDSKTAIFLRTLCSSLEIYLFLQYDFVANFVVSKCKCISISRITRYVIVWTNNGKVYINLWFISYHQKVGFSTSINILTGCSHLKLNSSDWAELAHIPKIKIAKNLFLVLFQCTDQGIKHKSMVNPALNT